MEQKWKVRSLISVSGAEEIGILSKVLIVISCIFCFLTLMLITFSVSYVDAGNTKKFTYTGGMEEKSETLYELGFVKETKMDPVLTKIYMKSNGVGKNNLYMEPYPVVVQKKQGSTNSYAPIGNRNNKYVNLLGGDELDINSQNISIIGGRDLKVLGGNNDNATIFGGESNIIKGSNSTVPRVIIGGKHNTIEGVNGVILGGETNTIKGTNSFILGGGSNTIDSSANNAIVAGIKVTTDNKNIFVFSNDNNGFVPKKDNTFYIKVQKGLGLNMDAGQGVASSGAVSFGSVRGIGNCNATNKGLIGLSGTCLYGCNGEEWQKIGCFDEKWEEDDYFTGYCTGTVYNNGTQGTDQVRYSWCNGGPEKYNNVVFETILWTGNGCPEIRDGENPCVYACAIESGYYYYNDPSGKDSGCKKDCEIPWNRSGVHHGTIITGYSATGVVCEESETAYGCNGKRAVMQCNDGKWVGIGGSKTKQIYNPKGSTDINDIIYKYESCTSSGNICSTGNYQFTKIIENRWFNSGSCTNHIVDVNNMCETTTTIYKGRCYPNHILTGVNGGKCQLGVDTTGCECKPKSQHGVCKYSSLPANAKPVKSWFVQIATGIDSENNWSPSSKSYVLYTGNKEAECTFECNDGFSYWSGQCLSNCTYSGNTYKNGETITGYQSSSVNCPNVCKSKQLTCVDGKWMGGSLTCKTKDKICDGYTFKNTIENAKCDGCTLYSGSLSGICTTGNTMFNCKCYYNAMSGYYVFNEEGTQCVPATTGANCNKGSKPEGNVDFNYGHTFTQTWSGGAKKWIPESVDYEYNKKGDCGFRCYNGSSYIKSKNKCEGDECINHNFGKTGSYYLYPGSNNGIVGNVGSSLYESASEAQVAYGEGKRCLYYCDKCYSKNGKKCSPKTFKIEYWCKDDGGKRNSTGTQNFTYGVATKVDKRCPDRTGYIFEGWSTGKNSTEASLKYDKKLTTGNYNSCSSTNFYAVYKCAQGYTQNGTECKKNSYTCTGSVPDFAVLVPGSATGGLSESIKYKLYSSESAAKGKACAYMCDGEHTYIEETKNGKTVAVCKRCVQSLSTNQTVCVDDVKCGNGYIPYYDEGSHTMKCGYMNNCKGSIPEHGKIPESYQYHGYAGVLFGGEYWYCGKVDYGRGCYFECEEGYECATYLNSFRWRGVYYYNMWVTVEANWTTDLGGNKCIDKIKACKPFQDATKNYKGSLIKSGFQFIIGEKDWKFITGNNHNDVSNKLKKNKNDCLFACYNGSMYKTGVTLATYNNGDNETKFCWESCGGNKFYSEDGTCEKCPYNMKPDTSFTILGNAVQCTGACKTYERYDEDTDSCKPLCNNKQYYREWSDHTYDCYDCDGELAGRDSELNGYTECIPKEYESCPAYTHRNYQMECVRQSCASDQYLDINGWCHDCVGKLTDWDETLGAYLGCEECEDRYLMEYNPQKDKCEYIKCHEDEIIYYYGCRSCSSGKEVDKSSKDPDMGNNYTRCNDICGNNRVYVEGSVYIDGTYCWPLSTDPYCPEGYNLVTVDGNYTCVQCLAGDEVWDQAQQKCVKKS